jgi:hypothetical protein
MALYAGWDMITNNPAHRKCELSCIVIRSKNIRRLAIIDKSCTLGDRQLIYSKEKLKNLFDRKRISNLVYLEGLEILKGLRKRKTNAND